MTPKEREIDEWCGAVQRAIEACMDDAPNAACRALAEALLKETYGWPEYPE